jgi:FMN reductase
MAMARILCVGGSPSERSNSTAVVQVLGEWMQSLGHEVDTLQLRDLPAEDLVRCNAASPAIADSAARLERASGVVIGTPVYKSSYSGLLKLWLDLLPQFGLKGKIILPIATGGSLTSVLAIDYAIRPVLNSMGTLHVLPGFFVLERWVSHEDGVTKLDAAADTPLRELVGAFSTAVTANAAAY